MCYQNINQSFQALNDTPVSPEHSAVKISLENKVLASRPTGPMLTQSQRCYQSGILVS